MYSVVSDGIRAVSNNVKYFMFVNPIDAGISLQSLMSVLVDTQLLTQKTQF